MADKSDVGVPSDKIRQLLASIEGEKKKCNELISSKTRLEKLIRESYALTHKQESELLDLSLPIVKLYMGYMEDDNYELIDTESIERDNLSLCSDTIKIIYSEDDYGYLYYHQMPLSYLVENSWQERFEVKRRQKLEAKAIEEEACAKSKYDELKKRFESQ